MMLAEPSAPQWLGSNNTDQYELVSQHHSNHDQQQLNTSSVGFVTSTYDYDQRSYSQHSTNDTAHRSNGNSSSSSNGYHSIPTALPQAHEHHYHPHHAHNGLGIIPPSPSGSAFSSSAASSSSSSSVYAVPPASIPSTPFHSYPHITFRLPEEFVINTLTPLLVSATLSPTIMRNGSALIALSDATSASAAAAATPTASLANHIPAVESKLSSSSVSSASSKKSSSQLPLRYSNTYHLSFRAYHSSDMQCVAALHNSLFPITYEDQFYHDLLEADRVTLLAFLERTEPLMHPESGMLVEEAPLLVGIATGRVKESSGQCRRMYSGYITTLGVIPSFRRLGLGRFLLRHIICMLREAESRLGAIFLHVLSTNSPAISMYKSVGFTTYLHLTAHYHIRGREYDALKMVKYIDLKKNIYEELTEERGGGWCTIM